MLMLAPFYRRARVQILTTTPHKPYKKADYSPEGNPRLTVFVCTINKIRFTAVAAGEIMRALNLHFLCCGVRLC